MQLRKVSATVAHSKLFNFLDQLFKAKIVHVKNNNDIDKEILNLETVR